MRRLFVVRHGNTFEADEEPRRIGSATDLPLVASGIAQATALGEAFASQGVAFAHAYAAPLARTTETARIVLDRMPNPPTLQSLPWLAEIDHGPDENRTEAEVVGRVGAAALRRWDEAGVPPAGWLVDPAREIGRWHALFAVVTADTLVVTSNGIARFARIAVERQAPVGPLKLRTGAFAEFGSDDGCEWSLIDWDVRPDQGNPRA